MQKGKILIVDDQDGWRELLYEVLSEDGFGIQMASNLHKAIELLKVEKFDVAILDMRLIDTSSYNVDGLRALKEAKNTHASIKAIILTGYPDELQKDRALNFYHADGYYEKAPDGNPFDIDKFRQIIFHLMPE